MMKIVPFKILKVSHKNEGNNFVCIEYEQKGGPGPF
jgi:hypothetical protein